MYNKLYFTSTFAYFDHYFNIYLYINLSVNKLVERLHKVYKKKQLPNFWARAEKTGANKLFILLFFFFLMTRGQVTPREVAPKFTTNIKSLIGIYYHNIIFFIINQF
jgi:hypothetical protein